MDSISGINSNPTQVPIEWVTGPTAVFQNTSTFSIGGDVTAIFDAGRRVRTFNTGGTIYGVVSTSVFSASTTITILTDSGILDSGLTSADYAVFDAAHVSFPFGRALQGINSPGLRIEFQTQFAQLLSALNGLTVQTGTLSASTAAFTGLLGFYGSGATTQAANISSVTSTGSVSTVGVFGFTTSTQPNNLVSTVNALSATLKRYGLTS
jgi:hypothetical protein